MARAHLIFGARRRARAWAGGLLGLWLAAAAETRAQDFAIAASATPNPVLVSNALAYTIFVTNQSGFNLFDTFVTNDFSGSVLVNNASNTIPGTISVLGSAVVFRMDVLFNAQVAQLQLNVSPLESGALTNRISVTSLARPQVVSTNVVTDVSFPSGDLAVGLSSAAGPVVTNDPTVIAVSVTNNSSGTIAGVLVSNVFPESLALVSVSPSNAVLTIAGSNWIWNIGPIPGGAVTQLLVTVRPTVAGLFPLTATVSGGVVETNLVNNTATNLLEAIGFLPANLTNTVLSQQLNRQTGLREIWVAVQNNGATNVPAVRLSVSGLTNSAYLYNAVGTNSGSPYVQHNASLAGGATVNLLLEFYVLDRGPLTNLTFTTIALPAASLSVPTNVTLIITTNYFVAGGYLIEFPATIGRTYTVLYADNLAFSNALAAQPAIVAPATRVQWIDNGPPKTISHPSNTTMRLYRVREGQ